MKLTKDDAAVFHDIVDSLVVLGADVSMTGVVKNPYAEFRHQGNQGSVYAALMADYIALLDAAGATEIWDKASERSLFELFVAARLMCWSSVVVEAESDLLPYRVALRDIYPLVSTIIAKQNNGSTDALGIEKLRFGAIVDDYGFEIVKPAIGRVVGAAAEVGDDLVPPAIVVMHQWCEEMGLA